MKSYLHGVLVLIIICIKLYESEGFCGNRALDLELVQLAVQSGEWLEQQRNGSDYYGEGHESAQIFLALKLLGFSLDDSAATHLKSELNRHSIKSLSAGRLAHYIHGVLSTCGDPRHLYKHLIHQTHHELTRLAKKSPFEYSLVVLALCNSGLNVHHKFTKILVKEMKDLQDTEDKTPFTPDVLAMGTVALACVDKKKFHSKIKKNIHHLLSNYYKKHDGSFGNEITTALVVQAIAAADRKAHKKVIKKFSWLCEDSMRFIINKKHHWFKRNVMSTAHILPSLIGAVLFDIGKLKCSDPAKPAVPIIEFHVKLVDEDSLIKAMGKNVTRQVSVMLPNDSNAHDILKKAAEEDDCFKFKTKRSNYGKFITEICGIPNNGEKNDYWMVYSTDSTLAPHGIDEFHPAETGSSVIFKYKKL